MYGSMFPPGFWQLMAVFLVGSGIVIFLGNLLARKWLGVKRKKLFSYNYLNSFHKKGEWVIRILFIISYGVLAGILYDSAYSSRYLLLTAFAFIFLLAVFRAIMEKRNAENPNDYLFTLFESSFALVVVVFFAALLSPEFLSL